MQKKISLNDINKDLRERKSIFQTGLNVVLDIEKFEFYYFL